MSYQPGIPTGSVPLNQDYLNLQQNFTQINDQFMVDHVPLTSTSGTPPNGYHEAIHMVPVSTTASNPPNNQPINGYTATAGYGQLLDAEINDGINTDTALFFLTGGNKLIQLTRNVVPVMATNGYTFMPGGLIFQWGVINGTHGSDNHFNGGDTGTVTFASANIAFPKACFSIWSQPMFTSNNPPAFNGPGNLTMKTSFSRTSFSWFFASPSSSYTRIFWFAIGN